MFELTKRQNTGLFPRDVIALWSYKEGLRVLDEDFTPLFSLNIWYPKGHNASVDLGSKIKPSDVSRAPNVKVLPIEDNNDLIPSPTTRSNTTYTFVLTDPDATSRADPAKAEMCHWIVTGISLDADYTGEAVIPAPADFQDSKSKELMSYYPPAPPPKTGYHRYVFVLLAPKPSNSDARKSSGPEKPRERPHWGYGRVGKGVRDWAEDNGLTPVGAEFFYAENEKQ
ncbi:MAG: hypothetical protein Q9179_000598 [Wetmoreana sp. 5 TL-2023]